LNVTPIYKGESEDLRKDSSAEEVTVEDRGTASDDDDESPNSDVVRPKFAEESLSYTTLDEIVGSRSSSMQFSDTVRYGTSPYIPGTGGIDTIYDKSTSRRKKASRNNSLSEECLEIVKKYKKPNEEITTAEVSSSSFIPENPVEISIPQAIVSAVSGYDEPNKKKLRSNPREWKVIRNDLTKEECIEFLKYHRWKEPVTNAPKGTGCRVSQCAIHSGCPHLLKMRLTNNTDLTRYTMEECFDHHGEVTNHNQGLHDFILEDVDYLLFAGTI
jgi:hypothetical protein